MTVVRACRNLFPLSLPFSFVLTFHLSFFHAFGFCGVTIVPCAFISVPTMIRLSDSDSSSLLCRSYRTNTTLFPIGLCDAAVAQFVKCAAVSDYIHAVGTAFTTFVMRIKLAIVTVVNVVLLVQHRGLGIIGRFCVSLDAARRSDDGVHWLLDITLPPIEKWTSKGCCCLWDRTVGHRTALSDDELSKEMGRNEKQEMEGQNSREGGLN